MSTTSAALLPLCSPEVNGSTGMPRPLSSTRQPPSASSVTPMRVQMAGHRLVDGVVDDLPDQVVEPLQTGGADVHARALAHRVEALEHLDVPWRRRPPWWWRSWCSTSSWAAMPRWCRERRSLVIRCRWTLVPRYFWLSGGMPRKGHVGGANSEVGRPSTYLSNRRPRCIASGHQPTSGVSRSRGIRSVRRGSGGWSGRGSSDAHLDPFDPDTGDLGQTGRDRAARETSPGLPTQVRRPPPRAHRRRGEPVGRVPPRSARRRRPSVRRRPRSGCDRSRVTTS